MHLARSRHVVLVTGSGDRPQDRGVTERQSSVRQIPGEQGQEIAVSARGDVAAILDAITDDVDWAAETTSTAAPWYGVRHGKEAVEEFFTAFGSAMEVEEFTPVSLAANDTDVLTVVRCRARSRSTGKTWRGPAPLLQVP